MAKLIEFIKTFGGTPQEDGSWLAGHRGAFLTVLNAIVFTLALLAIGSLVAEYGFYLPQEWGRYTSTITVVVLYGFIAQAFLKLLIVKDRPAHIRTRRGELAVFVLILLYLLFPTPVASLLLSFNPLLTPEAITKIYLVVTQVLILVALVPSTLRYSKHIMAFNIQPSMLILLSFLFLIAAGTGLLLLPRATVSQSFSFVDALFTSTSAVCVTGLIVVDTATHFTPFGQAILMGLIQVGGLGIMTLTTFFAYVVGSGGQLKEYSTMQSLLGEEGIGMIRRTIIQIALVTFAFEAVGAYTLFQMVDGMEYASSAKPMFFAVFHSISAFCNAGFTLTTENLAVPALGHNVGIAVVVMVLITVGGLGFPVLKNIGSLFLPRSRDVLRRRLTIHSKLVLTTSTLLVVGGTVAFYVLEVDATLQQLSQPQKILAALFHSVSARTAGFNTLDIGALAVPTLFIVTLLMWIGASPGSTGGGVKTTAFSLALLNIYAIASGRNKVEVFRHEVADIAVVKAFSTVILSFFVINGALFLLLITEDAPMQSLLFEIVSALSTVGLSTGITPQLSSAGKMIIILCMFIGRVGLLAVLIAVTRQRYGHHYDYTQENVLIT
ncbi:MAG TPA: potassium transporter TrkG [Bacteroidota bacterium]